MRKEEFNERQLKELENELRSLGTPYSAPEPDSRYFANFRVGVMERIREQEAAKASPWYNNVLGWIEEHLLVTSLGTAAVLVAVWASLMMQPLNPMRNEKLGVRNKQVAVNSEQPTVKIEAPAAPVDIQTKQPQKQAASKKSIPHSKFQIPNSPDLAMLDVPVVSVVDEVGPASLDELSASELESVLNILETE